MQGEVYVEHKYVNLVEIHSVVFKIREVEIGEILVRVNNTRVLRTTFLAARHTTVGLNTDRKRSIKRIKLSTMKRFLVILNRIIKKFEA